LCNLLGYRRQRSTPRCARGGSKRDSILRNLRNRDLSNVSLHEGNEKGARKRRRGAAHRREFGKEREYSDLHTGQMPANEKGREGREKRREREEGKEGRVSGKETTIVGAAGTGQKRSTTVVSHSATWEGRAWEHGCTPRVYGVKREGPGWRRQCKRLLRPGQQKKTFQKRGAVAGIQE